MAKKKSKRPYYDRCSHEIRREIAEVIRKIWDERGQMATREQIVERSGRAQATVNAAVAWMVDDGELFVANNPYARQIKIYCSEPSVCKSSEFDRLARFEARRYRSRLVDQQRDPTPEEIAERAAAIRDRYRAIAQRPIDARRKDLHE